MNDTAQTPEKDLIAGIRRCWCPECKKPAFFEDWGGWHWCYKHAWREIIDKESNFWFNFSRMRVRWPYALKRKIKLFITPHP